MAFDRPFARSQALPTGARPRSYGPGAALLLGLAVGALGAPVLPSPLGGAAPARAQQGEWFVPGGQQGQQGQQQGQQRPAQRPAGQPPPAAVIGIVDVPEIQRESTAFNQVREEIERRRQRLNDDLQREQTAWRDAQQQLANQRATLPPDQLRQRERDLQDRITESQRIFRERSRAIETVAQQALLEIEQALALVIRQVASGRNVNLVLPRPVVIFNDPAFDLTQEIAQQFNRQLRSVTIPPESALIGGETPQAAAPAQPPARPAGQQGQPAQQRR